MGHQLEEYVEEGLEAAVHESSEDDGYGHGEPDGTYGEGGLPRTGFYMRCGHEQLEQGISPLGIQYAIDANYLYSNFIYRDRTFGAGLHLGQGRGGKILGAFIGASGQEKTPST